MRSVRDIGDELYALPPSEFTAARDNAIAQARRDGDRSLAARLSAMRRPTQAAWLVNLLALRRPDVITELLELGDAIRSAQAGEPPGQLRDLSGRRRKALDAALSLAASLSGSAGQPPPGRAHLEEAEATLAAAMADESAANMVRSGRVIKALRYSGFGEAFGVAMPTGMPSGAAAAPSPTAPAPSPTAPARSPTAAAPPEAAAARRAEAAARRTAAEQRLASAARELQAARTRQREADDGVERLTNEIAALRERLETAQREARTARRARATAERDHQAAERRLRAME